MPRECECSQWSSLSYPNVLTPKVFLKSASGEGPPSNRIIQRSREQIAPHQRSTWKHQFALCLNYTVWFSHPGFAVPHIPSSCFTSGQCKVPANRHVWGVWNDELSCVRQWHINGRAVVVTCQTPSLQQVTIVYSLFFLFSLRWGRHTKLYATSGTCWLRPKLLKFLIRNNLWPMFFIAVLPMYESVFLETTWQ